MDANWSYVLVAVAGGLAALLLITLVPWVASSLIPKLASPKIKETIKAVFQVALMAVAIFFGLQAHEDATRTPPPPVPDKAGSGNIDASENLAQIETCSYQFTGRAIISQDQQLVFGTRQQVRAAYEDFDTKVDWKDNRRETNTWSYSVTFTAAGTYSLELYVVPKEWSSYLGTVMQWRDTTGTYWRAKSPPPVAQRLDTSVATVDVTPQTIKEGCGRRR